MTNRGSLKLISYNEKTSCPRTQRWPLNGRLAFEANWRVKKVTGGHHFLMGWPKTKKKKKKKNCHFEVSSSLILHNNRWFLDLFVIWDEKWILHDSQWWPVQWLNQEAAPKHFPKPNLHQKKGHSHCFMICWATTAFWILVKSLHLISMFSKSLRCNACSHHGLTERTQFFSVTTPSHTSHNQWFKSWKSGLWHFASSKYSPDLSPNDYHFFKHLDNFLQGKRFHNQQEAENAFQEFDESQSTDFTLWE